MPELPTDSPRAAAIQTPPLIYVASLADYNNGRLHGVWIRADSDPEAIGLAIQAMLAASPEPRAEEWAVHASEGIDTPHDQNGGEVGRMSLDARLHDLVNRSRRPID